MVELIDPLRALQEDRKARLEPSSRDLAGASQRVSQATAEAVHTGQVYGPNEQTPAELEAAIKADFRVLLTLIWRFLLNCDPSPDQLSLAHYAQHGPQRSVIMAFRGFSKSWIIGAYALWLLYCNPYLKVLIVSGSLKRAIATTNWCLQLIHTMPELKWLSPGPKDRQSALAFDVGPCGDKPDQSPSFHAAGIGGQIVGFRGDFILPDDVETQTNSLTVTGREKISEAVKEFDSILKPGGVIKFLGTPHDAESLYSELEKRGYELRVWPAMFPSPDQMKVYGNRLHPYITSRLSKNPALVGTPIQPGRFTPADLEARRLSLGNSEFALQFMLDTSLSDANKYPLKFRNLIVMDLDPKKGPEAPIWGTSNRITDLPLLGFAGDYYHTPAMPPERYAPWATKTGFVDPSGKGQDETALTIVGELWGYIGVLLNAGWVDGTGEATLEAIAQACVRYDVELLEIEDNFGDGMFTSLLRPVMAKAWKDLEDRVRAENPMAARNMRFGTALENVKSTNQLAKERRIIKVLEPATNSHRLIVSREVIEADERSLQKIEGEDTRRAYSLMYQFSHLTHDRESLKKDDRLESLAGALRRYSASLGVDPELIARRSTAESLQDELERLHGEAEELASGGNFVKKDPQKGRLAALSPSKR